MTTLQAVRDGLTALGGQVGSGDFIASVIVQLVTMVDVIMNTEQQASSEVRALHDKYLQVQGGLRCLSGRQRWNT